MDISLALIVKNEEENIAGCIQSADFCRQIVVVDTGSDDNTVEIALKNGAEIHFAAWENDFSKARNISLAASLCDWILVLDADERIIKDSFYKYAYLLKNPKIDGISVILRNYLDSEKKTYSEHRYTRLFRNKPQIRFRGRIHEQVSTSLAEMNSKIVEADIIIEHFGYIAPSQEKKERNKMLLEIENESNEKDDWTVYHLASTEFSLKNYSKAKELFILLLNSDLLLDDQKELVRLRIGQIYLIENDFEKINNILDFHFNNASHRGLKYAILGASELHKGNYKDAKMYYSKPETNSSPLVDKQIIANAYLILDKLS